MILTHHFLNQQLDIAVRKFSPEISLFEERKYFSTILELIESELKKIEKNGTDIQDNFLQQFVTKLELLGRIAKYRIDRPGDRFDVDALLDSLQVGKLAFWDEFFRQKDLHKEVTVERFQEACKKVLNKHKIASIVRNKDKIKELLDEIERGDRLTDDELIESWQKTIQTTYDEISKIRREELIDSSELLRVSSDNYQSLASETLKDSAPDYILKSGYVSLDRILNNEGFERTRLYLVAGPSGSGKSMFLINLICNAILNRENDFGTDGNEPANKKRKALVYITLENSIRETYSRFYCCLTNTPYYFYKKKIKEFVKNKDINGASSFLKDKVEKILKEKNVEVIIKYFTPGTSVVKVVDFVDEMSEQYDLLGIYVDYLDLMTSSKKYSEYRFVLGEISQQLKEMAIEYNVPVITVTQLNREGYDPSKSPLLTQISESMEKVHDSDCVIALQNRNEHFVEGGIITKIVRAYILKQRSGQRDIYVTLGIPLTFRDAGQESLAFSFKMIELISLNDPSLIYNFETIGGKSTNDSENSDKIQVVTETVNKPDNDSENLVDHVFYNY